LQQETGTGHLFIQPDSKFFYPLLKLVCIIGWCVAIILSVTPLYGTYKAYKKNPEPLTHVENVMFETFSRFSWSLALAWVIYACHTGYGGNVLYLTLNHI